MVTLSLMTEYNQYLFKQKAKQNRGQGSKDSERSKTYQSEWAFGKEDPNLTNIRPFKDIEEARKFALRVTKSNTWIKLWKIAIDSDVTRIFFGQPDIRVMSKNKNGRGYAGQTDGTNITLNIKTGLDNYTMIHELAHCLGHMHHGRSFRQTLLKLVSRFMGTEPAKMLKSEFKKRKLACGDARKPMSFDQWLFSRNRMQQMREKHATTKKRTMSYVINKEMELHSIPDEFIDEVMSNLSITGTK